MVNLVARNISKEIDYYGSTVIVRDVTDSSYTKWGDATELLSGSKVSYTSGDDNKDDIYSTNWLAQTFTTDSDTTPPIGDSSSDFNITDVRLKLYRTGSPGTITVSIKAVDGSYKPTGSDLSTGTLSGDNLTTSTSGEWKTINMSAYTLSAGTQYAIVIRATSGSASNIVHVRGDQTSASYTGGSRITSSDSGSTWTIQTNTDIMFNIYGDPVSTKAMAQVLTQADELVQEGIFQSGDIIFWFKSDETDIERGNRIYYNSKWYEVNELIEHKIADTTQVLEVRTRKV